MLLGPLLFFLLPHSLKNRILYQYSFIQADLPDV